MEELRLRLQYLEDIGDGSTPESTMMDQVEAIGSTLDRMLGVRKQEVQRMAAEVNSRSTDENGLGEEAPSEETKREVVASRFEDLSRLASELEAQLPLEMPEIKPPPDPRELLAKASELGREFDELTARSAELTKRLMEQLAKQNNAIGGLQD